MKVAVYTLTRERLEYTKRCFAALKAYAGHDYDHYVIDNGSQDGTREWLSEHGDEFAGLKLLDENVGISAAANRALDAITLAGPYDLILKIDNDCLVLYPDLLAQLVNIYKVKPKKSSSYMLSPRVIGLNKQPTRHAETRIQGTRIGWVGQVGGLCHILPGPIYQQFRYNEFLPKAWGQDENICGFVRELGGTIGYVEDLVVEHCETTDGQARRYPEYFERKWQEENLEATS